MSTRSGPPKVVVVLGFSLAAAVLALAGVLGAIVLQRDGDGAGAEVAAPTPAPPTPPAVETAPEVATPTPEAPPRPPAFVPGPPGTPGLSPRARLFLVGLLYAPVFAPAFVEDAVHFVRNDAETLIGTDILSGKDATDRARELLAPLLGLAPPELEPEPEPEPRGSRLAEAYERSAYAERADPMGFYAEALGVDLEGRSAAIETREVSRRSDGLGGCTLTLEATAPRAVRVDLGQVFALAEDGSVIGSWSVFPGRIGPDGRFVEASFEGSCQRIASWRAQW